MGQNDVSAGLAMRFYGTGRAHGVGPSRQRAVGYPNPGADSVEAPGAAPGSRLPGRRSSTFTRSRSRVTPSWPPREARPLLISPTPGARSFESRATPLALVDLEVDPSSPSRWVGSAEDGLYSSDDAGEGGGASARRCPTSWLAWPTSRSLFRVDPDGVVRRSSDAGGDWEEVGQVDGETPGPDGRRTRHALRRRHRGHDPSLARRRQNLVAVHAPVVVGGADISSTLWPPGARTKQRAAPQWRGRSSTS